MKKIKFVVYGIVITLFILLLGYFIQDQFELNVNRLYIEYGDELPDIEIIDNNNSKYNIEEKLKSDKVNLVCYVHKDCSSCIESLSLIYKFLNIKAINDNVSIILLWDDEVPKSNLLKNNIDITLNYSLDGKYKMEDYTPCFYLIEKGSVSFKSNNTEKLINKIFSYIDYDELQKSVISFLKTEIGEEGENFIFTTENCEECIELDGYSFDRKVYIISNYERIDSIIDKHNFFSKVFHVSTYPALLTVKDKEFYIIEKLDNIIHELQ